MNMMWTVPLIFWLLVSIFISLIFVLISILFQEMKKKTDSDFPFECGVQSIFSKVRVPFCLHFFTIMIIFLIFDIEIVISIPLVFLKSSYFVGSKLWNLILFLLFLGLVVEVSLGSLDWKE